MARFLPEAVFAESGAALRLLPFQFEKITNNKYLVSNLVGEGCFLSRDELTRLIERRVAPGDGLYEKAFQRLFIAREDQRGVLQLLALRLRSRMAFLKTPTQLHIFVVTLRCEHSCPYCQVSRRSADRDQYDMSEATAMQALKIAFSGPAPGIKIEFQGGEPLLNFDLIRYLVPIAKQQADELGKHVSFVVTTNLALLNDDILAFCKQHAIHISTSLDGPEDLHNQNRPRPGGNSYQLAVQGIRQVQAGLGSDQVGALMTTTDRSLSRVEEIIDTYVDLDLEGIFLRPLSPYGFAVKTKQLAKYNVDQWLAFYERGLRYILDLNKNGIIFREFYASMLLQRMLTDRPIGFVDLRSPAGLGLGALVYNYDGKIFASDEGRMLAEMGDRTFELGDVETATYEALLLSDKLVDMAASSLAQSSPQCSTCAYEPLCGADPVYHHATQGDFAGIKPFSGFCARQKGILGLLHTMLEESPEDASILRGWVAP